LLKSASVSAQTGLQKIDAVAKPATILGWFRRLVARLRLAAAPAPGPFPENVLRFPARADPSRPVIPMVCKQRLRGLLKYYTRAP
jgi:hypothetical protein